MQQLKEHFADRIAETRTPITYEKGKWLLVIQSKYYNNGEQYGDRMQYKAVPKDSHIVTHIDRYDMQPEEIRIFSLYRTAEDYYKGRPVMRAKIYDEDFSRKKQAEENFSDI